MKNQTVQTARGRCVRRTIGMNMINNNMDEAACFAGHLPLDPFSLLYHIAVILIRCGALVCVCTVCVYERFVSGEIDEERDVMRVPLPPPSISTQTGLSPAILMLLDEEPWHYFHSPQTALCPLSVKDRVTSQRGEELLCERIIFFRF